MTAYRPGPRTVCLIAFAALTASALAPAYAAKGDARVTKAPAAKQIDFDKLNEEAAAFLSKYIKINTTNPPGHELEAAQLLKDKFLSDGIPATVWEPEPGRGIVAARLRGIGKKQKTLILLSHMDVVPAEPKEWQVPPFSGEIKDGYVWGRGAIDDKGPGVIAMMAMLAIKRSGTLLDRDILFVATADEEEGGKVGAEWFTDHEKDIFSDAGYLLNEGGGIFDLAGGKKFYGVSVTEKAPLWIRLTAQGSEGHASVPPADTAVTRLVHALNKLMDYRPPIHVLGPVQDEFRVRAELEHGPRQWLDLATSIQDSGFARQFLAVPAQNAKVRDTIAPTVLSGSNKTNIIPASAYAEVDCRLLPGEDPKAFLQTIRKVIDDKSIKVDVELTFPATSSPSKSALMKALDRLARESDKAPTVPTMVVGFTDSRYFRRRNVVSYGFVPIEFGASEHTGVHGIDERIGIKQMGEAIRRMVSLLEIFGEARK
jgi:acetylornithine deacetylase/succinyl-diaminopimelate desuccinylase-like protein